MSKIDNFVYCLSANTSPLDKNIIVLTGVRNSLLPDFIPGNFTFSISFSILDIGAEEHIAKIEFLDPEGKIIANADNILIKSLETNEVPDEWSGVNVTLSLTNVILTTEGVYKTVVYFDEKWLGEKEIYVAKKKVKAE